VTSDIESLIFGALGTTVVVAVADGGALDVAHRELVAQITAVDEACSRFRADSELVALNTSAGRYVTISPVLAGALSTALQVAAETDGLVDPTIGKAIRLLGYDADFASLPLDGPAPPTAVTVPGWRAVRFDAARRSAMVPHGVELDLGATAKAWCADRAAIACAEATGAGVLVSLGGDIAVAGLPPEGGWPIRIADRHDEPCDSAGPVVFINSGGLATSSTVRRHWQRGGETLHHLLDPATGRPASAWWRTVSVAASSCVGANAASTASIVLGPDADRWLADRGLPARLVRENGAVVRTPGWPEQALLAVPR
jgi:thiamine biosynthesis lipoprotein